MKSKLLRPEVGQFYKYKYYNPSMYFILSISGREILIFSVLTSSTFKNDTLKFYKELNRGLVIPI